MSTTAPTAVSPWPHAVASADLGALLRIRDLHSSALSLYLLSSNVFEMVGVTEPPNYTKLSKKSFYKRMILANLSLYNPVVREIMMDFKPTHIPAKIVISLAVTITSYIKIHVTKYIGV
jgi:hypothetical protein